MKIDWWEVIGVIIMFILMYILVSIMFTFDPAYGQEVFVENTPSCYEREGKVDPFKPFLEREQQDTEVKETRELKAKMYVVGEDSTYLMYEDSRGKGIVVKETK